MVLLRHSVTHSPLYLTPPAIQIGDHTCKELQNSINNSLTSDSDVVKINLTSLDICCEANKKEAITDLSLSTHIKPRVIDSLVRSQVWLFLDFVLDEGANIKAIKESIKHQNKVCDSMLLLFLQNFSD